MIGLAMISLATVETRTSQISDARAEAEANARMALMIAIGDLQEHAGGDRTVTAPAAILSQEGFAGYDVDVSKSRYLMAFKTDANTTSWKGKKTDGFSKFLVSGNEEELRDLAFGGSAVAGDLVEMRSVNTPEKHQIRVPKVKLENGKGSIAYHVEGLSTKASIGVVNISEDENREHIAPDRWNVQAVLEELGVDADWLPQRGQEEELSKIITPSTADILDDNNEGLSPFEHWVGLQHYTVPIDTKNGGLKVDLTALLSLPQAEFDSVLSDDTNSVNEKIFSVGNDGQSVASADGVGPSWKQVQSFYKLAGVSDVEVREQTDEQAGIYPLIAGFVEMYCCTDSKYYAPAGKMPYLRPNHFNTRGNGVNVMNVHMAPIVKLWNPYNKPIKVSSYTISVANANQQYPGGLHADDAEVEWLDNRFLSYLPKPVRFDHRYVIRDVEFAPGEVKVFSLRDANVFMDMENGNYTPFTGRDVGKRVDVLGNGYILAELTEGAFTGHCLWDLFFTKKELDDYDAQQLNYVSGRATGGFLVGGGAFGTDGGDIQIYDTSSARKIPFRLRAGDIVNWNLKLYKGVVPKPIGGQDTRPLISIRNINMDSKAVTQHNDELVYSNPPFTPVFADGVIDQYISSTWARRFSLRMLNNYGDGSAEEDNFRPRGDTDHQNNVKWLANYNVRAPHAGLHPREYTKTNSNFYPGSEISINGQRKGANDNHGLGNVGNYLGGMLLEFADSDFVRMDASIGYSDTGEAVTNCILFELPSTEDAEQQFFNVGQLRHVPFSINNGNFEKRISDGYDAEDWFPDNLHPTYPVGESNPSPYIKLEADTGFGKYEKLRIIDGNNVAESVQVDMSWWMNDALWDSYFFSAIKDARSSHNPRIIVKGGEIEKTKEGVTANARRILIGGTMSVNTTEVNVWKAFLTSSLGAKVKGAAVEGVPFTRVASPVGDEVDDTSGDSDSESYNGYKVLSSAEISTLAEHIVERVKAYGPFYSVSDFVNRATSADAPEELKYKGLLQQAIDQSAVNQQFSSNAGTIAENSKMADFYNKKAFAGAINEGVPGYLTQGDVFARTGHLLTARDDTFIVRAYGESVRNGKVVAKVWCEAVVQRTAEYLDRSVDPTTPYSKLTSEIAKKYGRRMEIVAFRWISPEEINN